MAFSLYSRARRSESNGIQPSSSSRSINVVLHGRRRRVMVTGVIVAAGNETIAENGLAVVGVVARQICHRLVLRKLTCSAARPWRYLMARRRDMSWWLSAAWRIVRGARSRQSLAKARHHLARACGSFSKMQARKRRAWWRSGVSRIIVARGFF